MTGITFRVAWGIFVCVALAQAGCSAGGGSELQDSQLASTELPDTRVRQWQDSLSQGVVWVDDELADGVQNLPTVLPYGTDIITNGPSDPSSVLGCRYIFIVGEPPYQDVHGINKEVRSKTTVRVPDRIDGKHVWKFRTVGCHPWSIVRSSSANSSDTSTAKYMASPTPIPTAPPSATSQTSLPRMSRQQYMDFTAVKDTVGGQLEDELSVVIVLLLDSPHDANLKSRFTSTYARWNEITRKTIDLVPPVKFLKSHNLALRSLGARQEAYEMVQGNLGAGRPAVRDFDEWEEFMALLESSNQYMSLSLIEFVTASEQ